MSLPRVSLRCTTVWLLASIVLGGGAEVLVTDAVAPLRAEVATVEAAVVAVCSSALLVCLVWAWVVAGVVALEALSGVRLPVPGVPAAARRALTGVCGAALVGGLGAPVLAVTPPPGGDRGPTAPEALHGLPLPDRAHGGAAPAGATASDRRLTVRPGDTLWDIAAAGLPPEAPAPLVEARWRLLHSTNRDLIGPDPDLIHPGQQLRLPR